VSLKVESSERAIKQAGAGQRGGFLPLVSFADSRRHALSFPQILVSLALRWRSQLKTIS